MKLNAEQETKLDNLIAAAKNYGREDMDQALNGDILGHAQMGRVQMVLEKAREEFLQSLDDVAVRITPYR